MDSKATFALGCFWGPDDHFSKLPGVKTVTAGYSGGSTENPTYENLGDHTESVEIVFDPEVISYHALLEHFWFQHDPTYQAKNQYKSIIFYHDDQQKEQAMQSKESEIKKHHRTEIVTEIRPAEKFYPAEDYHQKYLQKNRGAVC